MRNISDTIARLSRAKVTRMPIGGSTAVADRLGEFDEFGSNPGNLRARVHVPDTLPANPALVVVLHGCTQSAAAYDAGSGWSELADRRGFILLFPEQRRENNANLCFNWFNAADTCRDGGEAHSIRQMIAAIVRRHDIDTARIFVTGLSAGGAMTAAMLAAYPDVFAGGAIVAGLPYGCATSIPEAFDRMRGHGGPDGDALGRLVRGASNWDGPWPTVSIWHGDADATVNIANSAAIVGQWRSVHGVGPAPSVEELVDGHARRAWHDAQGRAVVEEYRVRGMGHGTPLDSAGGDPCGSPGPYMLEAGISSTRHIAAFWGLDERPSARSEARPAPPMPIAELAPAANGGGRPAPREGAEKVIADALRAAGLMR